MLSDKDFCIEFVQRTIQLGYDRTKTNVEMIRIVDKQIAKDPATMFDDKAMKELYGKDPVIRFVYGYIRDNQHEFLPVSY